jgi:p-cumate 2,3-dioxygenase subunit alpha
MRSRIESKYGKETEERVTQLSRNILIFPNLVILDNHSLSIRTYYPSDHSQVEVSSWCLVPVHEEKEMTKIRLKNFLEFLGPGGFATPDDNEALELCQQGIMFNDEDEWNDLSKGMNQVQPDTTDEEQIRAFWRQWDRMMVQSGVEVR